MPSDTTTLEPTRSGSGAPMKWCFVCRGEDDLFQCSGAKCKRSYHSECAGLNAVPTEWFCDCCIAGRANRKEVKSDLNSRIKTVNASHNRMKQARVTFIRERRPIFEPVCNPQALNRADKMKGIHEDSESRFVLLDRTPPYINATLRPHQIEGINWLISCYERGIGGILGDEMGLGKTIQTLSLFAYLKAHDEVSGPHLVVTPVTVLQNWINEIQRFTPQLSFCRISGSLAERDSILSEEDIIAGKRDIYLTTYDLIHREESFFADCQFVWATITIDEGHRIKNDDTMLSRALARISCPFRLLLTGTPVQNNLHELWSLLAYVLPDYFTDSTVFDRGVNVADDMMDRDVCSKARALLDGCFMMRRLKSDVEKELLPKIECKLFVPLTALQRRWYRQILSKRSDAVKVVTFAHLFAVIINLRKVCNHPKQILIKRDAERMLAEKRCEQRKAANCEFQPREQALEPLSEEAQAMEQELRALQGETLVKSSGKLALLDRLLHKLRKQGSRVLLFSQVFRLCKVCR